jgi:hypothetical protein
MREVPKASPQTLTHTKIGVPLRAATQGIKAEDIIAANESRSAANERRNLFRLDIFLCWLDQ